MLYRRSRNYRIISVMFWSFPYLLWQAFGHWSGFIVGLLLASVLTAMFNGLFSLGNRRLTLSAEQQGSQQPEQQTRDLDEQYAEQRQEPYQRGYRAEERPYRAEPQLSRVGGLQPEYEDMQVPYPQEEMPPMELR